MRYKDHRIMSLPELTTWETEPLLEGYDPEQKEGEFKIAPAKWIWLPGERTLPCTFVFFRKEFELEKVPKVARGWIAADSRYVLYVNGRRIQFGPAPHDPRHAEADPVDVAQFLRKGKNVIGVHVLFYGQGDGTWPTGKPGLLFRLNIGKEVIASDNSWLCAVDRSHPPGGAKRWYLRALQERYVGSAYPFGWNETGFATGNNWYKAVELKMSSASSAFVGPHAAYNEDILVSDTNRSTMKGRSIPMIWEEYCEADLIDTHRIHWKSNIQDWFDFRVPGIYRTESCDHKEFLDEGSWLLTYRLPFGMVGWPIVEFETSPPNRGMMELIVQESCHPERPFLDTQFFSWTQFELNSFQKRYECFDYEGCRYIQLHLYVPNSDAMRPPTVKFRRRTLLKSHLQQVETGDSSLNRLLLASSITLQNSAQDIVVDGMARERQQYAGDVAHQLHAVRQAFGENALPRRFLEQFGYGQMLNGVWFDSWPAYDRYARLAQRQIGATGWGSLVDHSIGFVIEHVHHWLQTGDREPFEANTPAIQKFLDYLPTITGLDGLLKVDDLGAEAVWLDHDAYHEQSHKKLALNLYGLQMVAMLDWMTGAETDLSYPIEAIRKEYWHGKMGALINNRRDVATQSARYCDRSISHLLWLHAHGYEVATDLTKAIDLITKQPKSLGKSYPANSVWRHWAWARIGRVDLILQELRDEWATMYSVQNNTTIQEMWNAKPGGKDLMSHCAVAPTIMMHQAILGIGQDRNGNWFIRPQLGDLESFSIRSYTPWGLLTFEAQLSDEFHRCKLEKPWNMPLNLRTVTPIDLPFHDRGQEFSTDVSGRAGVEFDVYPYPPNRLIMEVESPPLPLQI